MDQPISSVLKSTKERCEMLFKRLRAADTRTKSAIVVPNAMISREQHKTKAALEIARQALARCDVAISIEDRTKFFRDLPVKGGIRTPALQSLIHKAQSLYGLQEE